MLSSVAALASALTGCPRFPAELCDGPGCVAMPDGGGVDAASPDGEGSRDDDDAFAVHVSPGGDDDDDGSAAAPVRTLARAFALADTRDAVVHACAGRFEERLRVEAAARRVSVRGGFGCSSGTWTARAGVTRVVASGAHRFDVRALRLRDIELEASADMETSAVAVDVRTATGARLEQVTVLAGRGRDGVAATASVTPAAAGLPGLASGAEARVACGDAAWSTGGRGGRADQGTLLANGSRGARAPDPGSTNNGGGAGDDRFVRACSPGRRGDDGPAATVSAPHGDDLDARTLEAERGGDGAAGTPGQGGGGGGTTPTYGDAPSGGSGGCGGAPGRGGAGGGSSVGVLLRAGALDLVASAIRTAGGGDGGAGSAGGGGARGGDGVTPIGTISYGPCASGAGGHGAGGSGGGGGHGGASIAVLAFARDGVVIDGAAARVDVADAPFAELGPGGSGGIGGSGGEGAVAASASGRVGKPGLRQALRFVTER